MPGLYATALVAANGIPLSAGFSKSHPSPSQSLSGSSWGGSLIDERFGSAGAAAGIFWISALSRSLSVAKVMAVDPFLLTSYSGPRRGASGVGWPARRAGNTISRAAMRFFGDLIGTVC
jgi:hypothetical protein